MKKERLLLERPRSLTDLVAEELRLGIINGQIELGSNLSEARIANDLGVSRTPVREALNKLETDGLLIVEPQRGSRVFSLESVGNGGAGGKLQIDGDTTCWCAKCMCGRDAGVTGG